MTTAVTEDRYHRHRHRPPPQSRTRMAKRPHYYRHHCVVVVHSGGKDTIADAPVSCRWLIVVSSVAPRLPRHPPPSKFISSPRRCAIVVAFASGPPSPLADHHQPLSFRSFTEHQLPLPLPLKVVVALSARPATYRLHHQAQKRFQFPHSWSYFDLLRVSTCLV